MPVRFTAITRSHSSGVMSRNLCRMLMPALFTSTSTPSIRRMASANAASTCIRSVTSAMIASPRAGNSCLMRPQAAASRSITHTRDPSSRNRAAVAAPIPLAPPVISTRLSFNPRMNSPYRRLPQTLVIPSEASFAEPKDLLFVAAKMNRVGTAALGRPPGTARQLFLARSSSTSRGAHRDRFFHSAQLAQQLRVARTVNVIDRVPQIPPRREHLALNVDSAIPQYVVDCAQNSRHIVMDVHQPVRSLFILQVHGWKIHAHRRVARLHVVDQLRRDE